MSMTMLVRVLQEEAAVCLQEKLKKTSLTVASLQAALNIKAAETREIEAKNAGDSLIHEHYGGTWCHHIC